MTEDKRAAGPPRDLSDRAVPWTVKDALLGIALVAVGAVLATALLGGLGDRGDGETNPFLVSLALALFSGLMVTAVWLFAIKRYGVPWRALGLARPQAHRSMLLAWLVLILSLAFSGLYTIATSAIGIDALLPSPIPDHALGEGPSRFVNIGIIGLAGPLAEEMFFRGFLLVALLHPLGTLRAVSIGSAVFAASHGSVPVLLPTFVSGILLSWLFLKTRSIWPPFSAHAAQNLIVLSLAA